MKISNRNDIDIRMDKHPSLIIDSNGKHRGQDCINIVIDNVNEYDTDLMPEEGTIVISLSNKDALKLIRQLAACVDKNVDEEFKELFPGVPPF